jgi:hypothetical protein
VPLSWRLRDHASKLGCNLLRNGLQERGTGPPCAMGSQLVRRNQVTSGIDAPTAAYLGELA